MKLILTFTLCIMQLIIQKVEDTFYFIDYAKALDCVDYKKLENSPRIPDHLTCLLRNLYASQEATVPVCSYLEQTGSK